LGSFHYAGLLEFGAKGAVRRPGALNVNGFAFWTAPDVCRRRAIIQSEEEAWQ